MPNILVFNGHHIYGQYRSSPWWVAAFVWAEAEILVGHTADLAAQAGRHQLDTNGHFRRLNRPTYHMRRFQKLPRPRWAALVRGPTWQHAHFGAVLTNHAMHIRRRPDLSFSSQPLKVRPCIQNHFPQRETVVELRQTSSTIRMLALNLTMSRTAASGTQLFSKAQRQKAQTRRKMMHHEYYIHSEAEDTLLVGSRHVSDPANPFP